MDRSEYAIFNFERLSLQRYLLGSVGALKPQLHISPVLPTTGGCAGGDLAVSVL